MTWKYYVSIGRRLAHLATSHESYWEIALLVRPLPTFSEKRTLGLSKEAESASDEPFDRPDFDRDFPAEWVEEAVQPSDSYVDSAKEDFQELFTKEPDSIFYQRQLQVIHERKYFHWVTVRALTELVSEGVIASEVMPLVSRPDIGTTTGTITFYRSATNRYWKRKAREVIRLVARFSDPNFTSAVGAHGEAMFDAALPRFGFMPIARKVREYGLRKWTATNHDLDRVFVRDGRACRLNRSMQHHPMR